MAILATSEGGQGFQPIEAGTYSARCVSMVHIGTVTENIAGTEKTLNKVRITWELPTETKEFKQGEGEKPYLLSKEFTLSLNEKATLRAYLKSWRGRDFTEDEAKAFDLSKLLGVPCMLSVSHKVSNGKTYADISGVSPVVKGLVVPPQITPTFELNYDNFTMEAFMTLPEFIRKKMETAVEFRNIENAAQMHELESRSNGDVFEGANEQDVPF